MRAASADHLVASANSPPILYGELELHTYDMSTLLLADACEEVTDAEEGLCAAT